MCSFCSYKDDKKEILLHEKNCEWNPKNKTCLTCKNIIIENNYSRDCKVIQQHISDGTKILYSQNRHFYADDRVFNCEKWEKLHE